MADLHATDQTQKLAQKKDEVSLLYSSMANVGQPGKVLAKKKKRRRKKSLVCI